MVIDARLALTLFIALTGACSRGPTRAESLAALRAAQPTLDGSPATDRIWRDGPPWFSCAEILVKVASNRDSAVVRDEVGNWRGLIGAGLVTVRDTAAGVVSDPGWCVSTLTPEGERVAREWAAAPAAPFPTGASRRGWVAIVGTHRLSVVASRPIGKDSAAVDYAVTVAPNELGTAVGAAADTTRISAALTRGDDGWRVARVTPAPGR